MANFIKFGLGIKDFLAHKMGGFGSVKYKLSHKELEELALQNEDVYKALEELGADASQTSVMEIFSKAKSNYEIASIIIRNKTSVLFDGAFSKSKEKTGDVYKYHFSSKKNLYSGFKSSDDNVDNITKILRRNPKDCIDEIIELYKQGTLTKEIARRFRVSENIISHLIPHDISRNVITTSQRAQKMEKLLRQGFSPIEVAQEFGVAPATVRRNVPSELIEIREKGKKTVSPVIKMKEDGASVKKIAQTFDIKEETVEFILADYQKHLGRKAKIEARTQTIIELFKSGMHPKEIAKKLKLGICTVRAAIPREFIGDKVKLNDEIIKQIIEMKKAGASSKVICEKFGIGPTTLYRVIPKDIKRPPKLLTEEVLQKVLKMRQEGHTIQEISQEVGISEGIIYKNMPKEMKTGAIRKISKRKGVEKITAQMQQDMIEMRKAGIHPNEIAQKYGIHPATVRRMLPEELRSERRPISAEKIKEIIEMKKSGMTVLQIAKQTGIHQATITRFLPAELKSRAKVKPETISKIIEMRKAGYSNAQIATELKISMTTLMRYTPKEYKNLHAIDTITEEELREAILKGKFNHRIAKLLGIHNTTLGRLYEKYNIISRLNVKDKFVEKLSKRYEQYNNDELKERFFNVVSSLLYDKKLDPQSILAQTIDKITDEMLENKINFETRVKLINLIRKLDLTERNVLTTSELLKSPELKEIKIWADKSKVVEDLKKNLSYYINDLLPQKNEFELAEILSNIKISGLDDPNIEIYQKYIQKLINSKNISKDCLDILHLEMYRNAPQDIKILAEKYSVSEVGEIKPNLAGQYIRNLMALRNPKRYKLPYPEKYIDIIKSEKLPENLSVRYMIKLENFFSETEPEKALLKDFCEVFDINGRLDSKIIEEYILNTYNKLETKILARGENMVEQEVTFCPNAKEGIIKQFGIPAGIKWITDFEDAMKVFISPDASRSGIKYMKNRGEYEVKISNESNRLLSSDKTLRFDIYKKEGLHTKKKK